MRAMMQMMVMLPLTIFKWSIIIIIFIKALIDPESWMEQDLAPSSFLGGWEHDEDDGHEFDSSAHLLWIRYTLMMHHLSWYQTWVAMLIYHEFDASAHCFLLLGAFDDDAIDWLLLNESQLQAWVKAPSSIHQQLPYFFLLHEGSSEFYAKPFPEPASQLADSEALWRDWLFCMKVHASSMPIPSQS